MPYKVYQDGNRFCVHKLNPDGSRGKLVPGGCHDTSSQAQAHKRALYANVKKEVDMSKAKRVKERQRRDRRRELELQKQAEELAELEELEDELTPEEEALLLESDEPEEDVEKSFDGYAEAASMAMAAGPTSFEDLDAARAAEEKASLIRRAAWDVEDLVHNIIRSPMLQGLEKADMIKKVGTDFGERVKGIMDTPANMLKENDPEVLEVEAIIASDERKQTIFEKAWEALPFKKSDKAILRKSLAEAVQKLKEGGEGAKEARQELPELRKEAKRLGIGTSMEKGQAGILVQKDAQGDWRWVGWPSNNFIDRSKDILTEAAHREYVDWWHKNKDGLNFPVFTSMHAPGTARTHPVDFVGYENGFLVMSGKLTEEEAAGLLKVQKEYDLGMSHTGWGVRSAEDPRQIVMYRIYEVTDLPLGMADNPFTDMAVISKEADMDKQEQVEYLATLLGSKEKAEEALSLKTSMKQKELQEANVEQKGADETTETESAETTPLPDMQAILEQVGKEYDIEALNEAFGQMKETLDKVPLLEDVIKQQQETIQKLAGEQDEALAEKLTPPAGRYAWSKENRSSQSAETKVKGKELEELQKKQAGIPDDDDYWLSQITNTAPVSAET